MNIVKYEKTGNVWAALVSQVWSEQIFLNLVNM